MKRMGYDIVQDSIWEQDDDSEEDQEVDGDDGDTFDMWDITVEDVEWIRKCFNIPNEIVQPLIPEPIHTTPPNDDYVAPVTKSILDELLEEFGNEILNGGSEGYSSRLMLVVQGIVQTVYARFRGLESVSIWRIQCIGYGVLGFLGVGTTFDIFQNIHILYLQYDVLVFTGYGVLIKFPLWSLNHVRQYAQSASLSLQSDASTIPGDQRPQLLERQSGLHGVNARHVSKANVSDVNQQRRQHQQELQL
ncbi:hypothetical protein Tco_0747126 [Tanacetum coccineum]